jgi:hypothetical protein
VVSDRHGFEYVELGPQRLPGAPASYLDVHPSGSADPAHGFERLDIAGRALIRYSRYLRIKPNDSQTNRGAYLAAGFLAARALPLHVAANCMDLVSQVVGHLKGLLGPDNSVGRDFRLGAYTFNGDLSASVIESRCSPLLLLDVLMQGLNAQGSLSWKARKPIFIDSARLTRADEIDKHLFYFGKETPAVQLRLERDREKLQHLTRQLARAASYADQVQDEWLSYQSLMQERLPAMAARGTELRDLIEDVEQLAESIDRIDGSRGAARPKVAALPQAAAAPAQGAAAFSRGAAGFPQGGAAFTEGAVASAKAAACPQPAGSGAVYPGPHRPRDGNGRTRRYAGGGRHDRRLHKARRWRFRPIALGIGAAILLTALAAAVGLWFLGDPFDPTEIGTRAIPAEDALGGDSGATNPAADTRESSTSGPGSTDEPPSPSGPGSAGEPASAAGAANPGAPTSATGFGSTAPPPNTKDSGSTSEPPGPSGTKVTPSSVAEERAALGHPKPK